MAKTPSDKLFRIIKSLSVQEKRYFRLFVGGRADRSSKYMLLFERIAAMETFDEEALKTIIYKSQPSEGKKYSELKGYLYELILKSLQSFDEQQSVEYRLNHLLQSTSALFRRGLYDDCREVLHKAKRLAQQYESFAHHLEIIRWEKQLAYTRMDVDFLHKKLEQLHFEESQAIDRLRNAADYRRAFFQVYTTIKKEALHRGEDRLTRLQGLVNQAAFSSPDLALSHKARVYYYRTLNLYHYTAQEYEQFYETGRQLIHLLESRPHFLRENLSDYIAALNNLILSCGLLQKYAEAVLCLNKLRDLKPVTEDDRRKIHRQYFSNKLALCIFSGDFEEGRKEMERCQREAARFDPQDYETASFYFQYACICFGNEDFEGTLDWLNHWLNQPRSVGREDLQSLARILSLLTHFEMGNNILVESLLRSAARFMRKKNRLFALERRFMLLLSELVRAPHERDYANIFRKMQTDLLRLAELPEAQVLIQTFDLAAWVDGQASGLSFAQVVREKWLAAQGL